MENKRILNESSWIEDKYWVCPNCEHKNENLVWMNEENCTECGDTQRFDTDYVDAYEGVISKVYLGPK
jgi:hypothetical protein